MFLVFPVWVCSAGADHEGAGCAHSAQWWRLAQGKGPRESGCLPPNRQLLLPRLHVHDMSGPEAGGGCRILCRFSDCAPGIHPGAYGSEGRWTKSRRVDPWAENSVCSWEMSQGPRRRVKNPCGVVSKGHHGDTDALTRRTEAPALRTLRSLEEGQRCRDLETEDMLAGEEVRQGPAWLESCRREGREGGQRREVEGYPAVCASAEPSPPPWVLTGTHIDHLTVSGTRGLGWGLSRGWVRL